MPRKSLPVIEGLNADLRENEQFAPYNDNIEQSTESLNRESMIIVEESDFDLDNSVLSNYSRPQQKIIFTCKMKTKSNERKKS